MHRKRAASGPLSVQYRIQFLDRSANVIREWSANARSLAGAIELIRDADWPPRAATMRVLDAYGREVHSCDQGRRHEIGQGRSGAGAVSLLQGCFSLSKLAFRPWPLVVAGWCELLMGVS